MKMTNTSEKVIGVGTMPVLPGQTVEVPSDYEGNPTLEAYKKMGLITLSGKAAAKAEANAEEKAEEKSEETSETEDDAAAKAEAEKQAKIAALKDASDEEVAAMAKELGINPAECKNLADVRKKVKAALSK